VGAAGAVVDGTTVPLVLPRADCVQPVRSAPWPLWCASQGCVGSLTLPHTQSPAALAGTVLIFVNLLDALWFVETGCTVECSRLALGVMNINILLADVNISVFPSLELVRL